MEPVDDINNDFGEWVWICFTTKYTFACFFFVPDDLLPYSFFFSFCVVNDQLNTVVMAILL